MLGKFSADWWLAVSTVNSYLVCKHMGSSRPPLTHASVHASCLPSPEVFSTSLFAIAIIAQDGRLCDSGALGSGRLSFGLKYVPGHGHVQKKLHYVFIVILQQNFVLKYFVVSKKLLVDENIS